MKRLNQKGFSIVEAILIIVVVALVAGIGLFVFGKNKNNETNNSSSSSAQEESNNNEVKIKHLAVEFGPFDPATNKAGDFLFTKDPIEFDRLFFEFGFVVPANSAGPEKENPQPTFIVPLGTKVRSLIDGEVVDVPKLYSDDYSVMVKGEGSDLIFETEHVINVMVKKGDKVKAGDIIAEVSDYDAKNYNGMGLVEIGILQGGNPPLHLCPFDYLDDSIKEETFKDITAFKKSWEEYRGDKKIYDDAKTYTPGCLTLDPVEG